MKRASVLALLCLLPMVCAAQTSEFTYQGNLNSGGTPATGNFDFEFRLFDALTNGNQIGPLQTRSNVAVAAGVFAVNINFGAAFSGADRFMEIRVRAAGGGAFTSLEPRHRITSSPYAVKALVAETAVGATNAATATNALQLGGVAANQYVVTTDPRMTDARVPTAGSPDYIQNTQVAQALSNFNISGEGEAETFDSRTNYRIGGFPVVSILGTNVLFVGVFAGENNTAAGSTFLGREAGRNNTTGVGNTFVGSFAGRNGTTAVNNSFFGSEAGRNTTGSSNAYFGASAGLANTIGAGNAFFGNSAGRNNTSGNSNSFFGSSSGTSVTTGVSNAFFGAATGRQLTIGNVNSFFGVVAGDFTTTGSENSFLGGQAGQFNTTGSFNTFVGVRAGRDNTVGTNNTTLGTDAAVGANDLTYATAIGSGATVFDSNSIVLGRGEDIVRIPGLLVSNGSVSGSHFRAENVTVLSLPGDNSNTALGGNTLVQAGLTNATVIGSGVTATQSNSVFLGRPADTVRIAGDLQLGALAASGSTQLCRNALTNFIASCSSSLRYKTNIASFGLGLDLINQLRPITFDWKNTGMHDLGLGAEDVAAIEPLLVTYNKDGQVEGVKYDRIGVVMINAIKEQQAEIDQLKRKVALIDSLKQLVCAQTPHAAVCKEEE